MIRVMLIAAAVAAGSWATTDTLTANCSKCAPPAAAAPCCDGSCCGDDCAACCGDSCALCCGTSAVNFVAADAKPAAKEVKLTGTLVCGSCKLNETKKCTNVLQVKEGDKTVNYYLDDTGNGAPYHEGVCGGGKVEHVTVTGTVTEANGKKTVKPTKVDVKK